MEKQLDLNRYDKIVVLTGAGVSVASGIKPFRGRGGIWNEVDVMEFASLDALRHDPVKVWRFLVEQRRRIRQARPNPAHFFLAELEHRLPEEKAFTLITQNVDGLHQLAGSRNIVEIHGNIFVNCCSGRKCGLKPFSDPDFLDKEPPPCPVCGAPLRMGTVFFGEQIPMEAQKRARRALRNCDLFIAIGTSGDVTPAADFVRKAKSRGAWTVLINAEKPVNHHVFHQVILGRAEDILSEIFQNT
jgi:NAD-dependent deacetylase